ncbi:bifunctional UDP-N-acetylglucosamine diphosphorylase/glucosamine-1-phosphate N-acetyltransferase GlmU [Subtercola boreus]|uniref:Bifunctional protein GlmU n=1 Tax=Subtercola boreus TaxID=120213 RepID=A0A3E0WC04_9MICO|nr:bifunctional UDP-N-acetylglucosamine diphosphorylase/glucosamine-1-phosphate N-acetyltransferase GlmU [Subtercola boreus]RFA19862.1 UDP-N-acetylglucosamine diphosphorylase/glucosamine-1-phosphate N-acetyltransferase [Subtercola boreus]RFA19929.1 UDP-N-acetylglucosamine diphosphorylase/glucosamine-1-phosphate N-acetyltransferase [Subtercola boreus]RFA26322.1 UDP-N-acetylglucosamine diphosphorylase/glucosamine-1-phosphate N-acetyltransferase [Subtercola boreus]
MTDSRLAIIILAAGQGTRMKSETPKLLHHLAGIPIVSHVLATARELDAAYTIAVVRHERDRLVDVITDQLPDGLVVDQDDVPGTGRAVEQAMDALPLGFDGDVLVMNGDTPMLDVQTLSGLVAEHRRSKASATLLSAYLDDPSGYGRIIRHSVDEPSVDRIVEHRDATESERAIAEINAGVYMFGVAELRDLLPQLTLHNAQGEKYLTDVVELLRRAGSEVSVLPVAESWLVAGINDRAQLSEAAAKMNALIIRGWQLAGVTVHDPATTWIDLKASIEPDVTLLPGTQIRGATVIARGAVVGPDTTLVDCEVGAGATVKRTDAELSVIGAGASVGPFAYLRPNTVLGANGKIGTFVETKNAQIGEGSKVPHLSYVGDAHIGAGSNIGAATIFANYNGVVKNHTEVGSEVRTGSHNVFVAPVTIGDGAYSAAGTVVRKNVPPGSLAVNIAPQRNLEGWVAAHREGSAADRAAKAALTKAALDEQGPDNSTPAASGAENPGE